MCNMQVLVLDNNKIGDPGITDLFNALGNGALPALEKLFLDSNQIGDAAISAFESACASGALASLEIV